MSEKGIHVSPAGSGSPITRQEPDMDALAQVAAYVELEMTSSWQRKTGLETRSFALVTMNLGAATLYFALQGQLGLSPTQIEAGPRTVLLVSLIASCVSIMTAAASALPLNYPGPKLTAFDELFQAAKDNEAGLKEEILEARIFQLKRSTQSNALKAAFIVAAFSAFALAATTLIVAILWAGAF
jgi:hypothetical protein